MANKEALYVSQSYSDPMVNSAYADSNGRQFLSEPGYGWGDVDKVRSLTALLPSDFCLGSSSLS